jgi:hypothetical protein
MTEQRKYAILFATTILCARKLIALESDKPSPAKVCTVQRAIDHAAYIPEKIDQRWPDEK